LPIQRIEEEEKEEEMRRKRSIGIRGRGED
jgi:hypothetical protein